MIRTQTLRRGGCDFFLQANQNTERTISPNPWRERLQISITCREIYQTFKRKNSKKISSSIYASTTAQTIPQNKITSSSRLSFQKIAPKTKGKADSPPHLPRLKDETSLLAPSMQLFLPYFSNFTEKSALFPMKSLYFLWRNRPICGFFTQKTDKKSSFSQTKHFYPLLETTSNFQLIESTYICIKGNV